MAIRFDQRPKLFMEERGDPIPRDPQPRGSTLLREQARQMVGERPIAGQPTNYQRIVQTNALGSIGTSWPSPFKKNASLSGFTQYQAPPAPYRFSVNLMGDVPPPDWLSDTALGTAFGVPGQQRGGTIPFRVVNPFNDNAVIADVPIATTPVNLANFGTYMREAPLALLTSAMGSRYQQGTERPAATTPFEALTDVFIDGMTTLGNAIAAPFEAMNNAWRDWNAQSRGYSVAQLYATGQTTSGLVQWLTSLFDQTKFNWKAIVSHAEQQGVSPDELVAKLWDLDLMQVRAIRSDPVKYLGTGDHFGFDVGSQALKDLVNGSPYSRDPMVNTLTEITVNVAPFLIGAGELKVLGYAGTLLKAPLTFPAGVARGLTGVNSLRELGVLGRVGATADAIGSWSLPAAWRASSPTLLNLAKAAPGVTVNALIRANAITMLAGGGIRFTEWGIKQIAALAGAQDAVDYMDSLLWEMPLSENPGLNIMDSFAIGPVVRTLAGRPSRIAQRAAAEMGGDRLLTGQVVIAGLSEPIKVSKGYEANLKTIESASMEDVLSLTDEFSWDRADVRRVYDSPGVPEAMTHLDLKNMLLYVAKQIVRERKGAALRYVDRAATMVERTERFEARYGDEAAKLIVDALRGDKDARATLRRAITEEFWTRKTIIDASEIGHEGGIGGYVPQAAFTAFVDWQRVSKFAFNLHDEAVWIVPALRRDINEAVVTRFKEHLRDRYQPGEAVSDADINQLAVYVPVLKPQLRAITNRTRRSIERLLDREVARQTTERGLEMTRQGRNDSVAPILPADAGKAEVIARKTGLEEVTVQTLAAMDPGDVPGPVPDGIVKLLHRVYGTPEGQLRRDVAATWERAKAWFDREIPDAEARGVQLEQVGRLRQSLIQSRRWVTSAQKEMDAEALARIEEALIHPAGPARDAAGAAAGEALDTALAQFADRINAYLDDPLSNLPVQKVGDLPVVFTEGFEPRHLGPIMTAAEKVKGNPVFTPEQQALLDDPLIHPLRKAAIMRESQVPGLSAMERNIINEVPDVETAYGDLIRQTLPDNGAGIDNVATDEGIAALSAGAQRQADELAAIRGEMQGLSGMVGREQGQPVSDSLRNFTTEATASMGTKKVGGVAQPTWRAVKITTTTARNVARDANKALRDRGIDVRIGRLREDERLLAAEEARLTAARDAPVESDYDWTPTVATKTKHEALSLARGSRDQGVASRVVKTGPREWTVESGTLRERPVAATVVPEVEPVAPPAPAVRVTPEAPRSADDPFPQSLGYGFGDDVRVEDVPVDYISRFMELDREKVPKGYTPEGYLDDLEQDIARNGLQEPLILSWDPATNKVLLGEGNHRLAVARRQKWATVPVRVVRDNLENEPKAVQLSGNPMVLPDEHGWVSADLRPSQVLADDFRGGTEPAPEAPSAPEAPAVAPETAAPAPRFPEPTYTREHGYVGPPYTEIEPGVFESSNGYAYKVVTAPNLAWVNGKGFAIGRRSPGARAFESTWGGDAFQYDGATPFPTREAAEAELRLRAELGTSNAQAGRPAPTPAVPEAELIAETQARQFAAAQQARQQAMAERATRYQQERTEPGAGVTRSEAGTTYIDRYYDQIYGSDELVAGDATRTAEGVVQPGYKVVKAPNDATYKGEGWLIAERGSNVANFELQPSDMRNRPPFPTKEAAQAEINRRVGAREPAAPRGVAPAKVPIESRPLSQVLAESKYEGANEIDQLVAYLRKSSEAAAEPAKEVRGLEKALKTVRARIDKTDPETRQYAALKDEETRLLERQGRAVAGPGGRTPEEWQQRGRVLDGIIYGITTGRWDPSTTQALLASSSERLITLIDRATEELGPAKRNDLAAISRWFSQHTDEIVGEADRGVSPAPIVSFPDPFDMKTQVPARVVAVDLDALTTSFDEGFPEFLQPRDREGRAASEVQINQYAADVRPELLTATERGDIGMPVVNDMGAVVAGNGRTEALRRASDAEFAKYRAVVEAEAAKYGISQGSLATMKRPVLVRELVGVDEVAQRRLAWQLNRLPPGELAPVFGNEITRSDIRALKIAEGEDIADALAAAKNQPAVTAMLERLPVDWRNDYRAPEGGLNAQGVTLLQGALLSKLLRADDHTLPGFDAARRVVISAVEMGGEEGRRIINGVFDAAGDLLKAQDLAEVGTIGDEFLAINDDIVAVLGDIIAQRQAGKTNAEIALGYRTGSMFEDLALSPQQRHMALALVESASVKEVATFLRGVAKAAHENAPAGGALFDDPSLRITPEGLLNEGLRAWNDARIAAGREPLDPFPLSEAPYDVPLGPSRTLADGSESGPVVRSQPVPDVETEVAERLRGEDYEQIVDNAMEAGEVPPGRNIRFDDPDQQGAFELAQQDPEGFYMEVIDQYDTFRKFDEAGRRGYFDDLLERANAGEATLAEWLLMQDISGGLIRRDAETGALNMPFVVAEVPNVTNRALKMRQLLESHYIAQAEDFAEAVGPGEAVGQIDVVPKAELRQPWPPRDGSHVRQGNLVFQVVERKRDGSVVIHEGDSGIGPDAAKYDRVQSHGPKGQSGYLNRETGKFISDQSLARHRTLKPGEYEEIGEIADRAQFADETGVVIEGTTDAEDAARRIAQDPGHRIVVDPDTATDAAIRAEIGAPPVRTPKGSVIEFNAPTKAAMAERLAAKRLDIERQINEAELAKQQDVDLPEGRNSVFPDERLEDMWDRLMTDPAFPELGAPPLWTGDPLGRAVDGWESISRGHIGQLTPEEAMELGAFLENLAWSELRQARGAMDAKARSRAAQRSRRPPAPPEEFDGPGLKDAVHEFQQEIPRFVTDNPDGPLLSEFSGTQYELSKAPTIGRDGQPLAPRLILRDHFAESLAPGITAEFESGRQLTWKARVERSRVAQAIDLAIGPRHNRELRAQSIRNFGNEMGQAADSLDEFDEAVRVSGAAVKLMQEEFQSRTGPGGVFPLYRRIDIMGKQTVNGLYERALKQELGLAEPRPGEAQLWPRWYQNLVDSGVTPYDAWRHADNRLRNWLREHGTLGQGVEAIYGGSADRVAHGGRFVTFAYHIFRTALELRLMALEVIEPAMLALGEFGPGPILEVGRAGAPVRAVAKRLGHPIEKRQPLAFGKADVDRQLAEHAWATGMLDVEGMGQARIRYMTSELARRQMPDFRKVVKDMMNRDPAMAEFMAQMGDDADGMIRRLNEDWLLAENTERVLTKEEATAIFRPYLDRGIITQDDFATMVSEGRYVRHEGIERALAESVGNPLGELMFTRLRAVNDRISADLSRTMFGQPDRSNLQRLLNHPLLFWPISYQIKATKWLLRVMFDHGFGMQLRGYPALVFQNVWDEHKERMRTDPAYAQAVLANRNLYFLAGQLLPISPLDVGVSMSPWTRMVLDDDYRRNGGMFGAGIFWTTQSLLPRVVAEQRDAGGYLEPGSPLGDAIGERAEQFFPQSIRIDTTPNRPASTSQIDYENARVAEERGGTPNPVTSYPVPPRYP